MPWRFFPTGPINVGQRVLMDFRLLADWLDSTAYAADIVRFAYGGVEGCKSHRRCPPPPVAFRLN